MKKPDLIKHLANRINQPHVIESWIDKIQKASYKKGYEDAKSEQCVIADVSNNFTKNEVINILQKRADNAFHKFNEYERNEILQAIDIITRLMPPSSFPDW